MKNIYNFIQFFIAFVLISLFYECKTETLKTPPSYGEFPIDTTVQIIQSFPSTVDESSGIIIIDDKVWTHNDSGDDPILYKISIETGKVLETIEIENAKARDWEDITQNSQSVFVGDFGNNGGKRKDLAIYKINKIDLLENNQTAEAFKINFTYPDRTNFYPSAYQHNFDCEALIAIEDSLYLFSKNHLDKHSRLYSLAINQPQQAAHLKARFDTKGLITGAGIDKEKKILALVGYSFDTSSGGFAPFVWLFWDYPNRDFFGGKSKRINLPFFAQTEAICFWKDNQFLISTEKSKKMRGKLLVLDAKKWIN